MTRGNFCQNPSLTLFSPSLMLTYDVICSRVSYVPICPTLQRFTLANIFCLNIISQNGWKSVSNPRSKPDPVRQFPIYQGSFCLLIETSFQLLSALGRPFYLSMSRLLSEIWKASFFASCIVLSKSGTVNNYLYCSIFSDSLVENWDTC